MRVGKAVIDLDLVTDLGRRPFVIGRSDDAPLRARGVAYGDAAVARSLGPIFKVQIELAEIAAPGVEPGLRIHPALELLWSRQRASRGKHLAQVADSLAEQRAVRHYGPLAVTDRFPAVQILAVEQRLPVGGGERPGQQNNAGQLFHKASSIHSSQSSTYQF